MSEPSLGIEKFDGFDRITLDRPDRLNAIDQRLAEALLAYFEARRRDTAVRVVILRGAGRAFCAGADLKARGQPNALQDGPNGDWVLRDVIAAMRACPQPIVALVKGPVVGGGFALALAADVIVADETAKFQSAFMKIGLSGSELGVSWRLQRAIGVSKAREMLLCGRPLDAAEALRLGLVSSVLDDGQLDEHGLALVQDMLAAAPDALRLSKRSLDATLEATSLSAAIELEERAQMLMIARHLR